MGHPPNNDECNLQIAGRGLRVIEHSRHIPCYWSSRADAFNLSSFDGLRPSRALACGSGAPLPVVCLDEIRQEELGLIGANFQP